MQDEGCLGILLERLRYKCIIPVILLAIAGLVTELSVVQQLDVTTRNERHVALVDPQGHLPNETHWCIVDETTSSRASNSYPHHFAHMAENLLPCWSWFRQKRATLNCGFVFLDGIRLDYDKPPNPWQKQLVNYMGCHVRFLEKSSQIEDRRQPLDPSEPIQHSISLKFKQPRFEYFRYIQHPDDTTSLRRLVVSDEWIENHRPNNLLVGILQRTRSRSFLDLNQLVDAVQKSLPDAVINVTTLDTPWLQEQAQWFATKDVIVAGHGAALANSIFLRPSSVVMQMYGPGSFYPSLDPLIEQAGSIALDWSPDDNPYMTMQKNSYRAKLRNNLNNISLDEDALESVTQSIIQTLQSLGRL